MDGESAAEFGCFSHTRSRHARHDTKRTTGAATGASRFVCRREDAPASFYQRRPSLCEPDRTSRHFPGRMAGRSSTAAGSSAFSFSRTSEVIAALRLGERSSEPSKHEAVHSRRLPSSAIRSRVLPSARPAGIADRRAVIVDSGLGTVKA